MSEAKCAEAASGLSPDSLHTALYRLEEALLILDDQAVSPELGAHLDLVVHRLRDEIARLGV